MFSGHLKHNVCINFQLISSFYCVFLWQFHQKHRFVGYRQQKQKSRRNKKIEPNTRKLKQKRRIRAKNKKNFNKNHRKNHQNLTPATSQLSFFKGKNLRSRTLQFINCNIVSNGKEEGPRFITIRACPLRIINFFFWSFFLLQSQGWSPNDRAFCSRFSFSLHVSASTSKQRRCLPKKKLQITSHRKPTPSPS